MPNAVKISLVTRFHDISRLTMLTDCLLKVSRQTCAEKVEQLVVCQNMPPREFESIGLEVERHRFSQKVILLNVKGDGDIRSKLLNVGIAQARGSFLGFLDYDDEYAPEALMSLLCAFDETPSFSMIAGRVAVRRLNSETSEVVKVDYPYGWGVDKFDLVLNNFLPIHAYLINLERFDRGELCFSEDLTLMEDYEFLVRLSALPGFKLRMIEKIIGFHNLRTDGSNSSVFSNLETGKLAVWTSSEATVRKKNSQHIWSIGHDDLYRMVDARLQYRSIAPYLGYPALTFMLGFFRLGDRPGISGKVFSYINRILNEVARLILKLRAGSLKEI